jgi:large subunit ribosomal protein L17
MKKKKNIRKFGRVKKVRKGMFKALISSLVFHGKIETTEAKAKEIRPMVERLVTLAKRGGISKVRLIASKTSKDVAEKIVSVILPKYEKRNGGYTRIIKTKIRKSDGAKMAVIEFV